MKIVIATIERWQIMDKIEIKNKIMELVNQEDYKLSTISQICMILNITDDKLEETKGIIDELVKDGILIKNKKNKFGTPTIFSKAVGILHVNSKGFGFLTPEDDKWNGDIYINSKDMNGAMNGDRVIAKVESKKFTSAKHEGTVESIITRATGKIVGTLNVVANKGIFVPDDRRMENIFIDSKDLNGATINDKVIIEITKWPADNQSGEGKILEVIGVKGDPGVDVMSIVKAHNLRTEFPAEVLDQVKTIPQQVSKEMTESRKDLRNTRVVTIDSEDTKDVDDGVSIKKLENGNYILGVHIADVSHYVTQGSPLDAEAYARGTSVYLVDRVLPMLPRELSNGICSLNVGVDRLAFSVIMEIDKAGEIIKHDIFESVINVEYKVTYKQIYKIFEEEDVELKSTFAKYMDDLILMKELAKVLGARRKARGSLDFNFPEAKVYLDEKGKPIDVQKYEITFANNIIEEFMLICNETVAERFFWLKVPFVYRVHAQPDAEKMLKLATIVKNLGYSIKSTSEIHPKAIQELLTKIKGKREERVINTIALRSMQKAIYKGQNDGHFGLAAKYYTHFTSPIRRYPDLLIHRIMKLVLKNELTPEKEEFLRANIEEFSNQCSVTERESDMAENESIDLKKVEFMKEHEGEEFEGVISNVTSFGMFVELDNTIEGLVRYASMKSDYYVFDEDHYTVTGERSGFVYRIGDTVNVIVARADIIARQIDFALVESSRKKSVKANIRTKVPSQQNSTTKLGFNPKAAPKAAPKAKHHVKPKAKK